MEEVMRDFDAEVESRPSWATTFRLGGKVWHTLDMIPLGVWLKGQTLRGTASNLFFIEHCLVPEEREAFQALTDVDNLDVRIDTKVINDLVVHLMEVLSGRPTTPPEDSSGGQPATGDGSKAGSRSKEPVSAI